MASVAELKKSFLGRIDEVASRGAVRDNWVAADSTEQELERREAREEKTEPAARASKRRISTF
jgi:hypothetical protein